MTVIENGVHRNRLTHTQLDIPTDRHTRSLTNTEIHTHSDTHTHTHTDTHGYSHRYSQILTDPHRKTNISRKRRSEGELEKETINRYRM